MEISFNNKNDEAFIYFEGHTFKVSYDDKTNENLKIERC